MDVTYLTHILENGPLIDNDAKSKVKKIREDRNGLCHEASPTMDEKTFKKFNNDLRRAIREIVECTFDDEDALDEFMGNVRKAGDPAAWERRSAEDLKKCRVEMEELRTRLKEEAEKEN